MKRSILVFIVITIFMIFTFTAQAYEETRNFNLTVHKGDRLNIDTGAGQLIVNQKDDINTINVEAVIRVENISSSEVEDFLDNIQLFLERRGSTIYFKSRINEKFGLAGIFSFLFNGVSSAVIDVQIDLPAVDDIYIDDSSGDIVLNNINSTLRLDDSSGDIEILGCNGEWNIDDGSGEIFIEEFTGDLDIEDGSGGLDILNSYAAVRIDDGSGRISIDSLNGDCIIDDGSGNMHVENLTGNLEIDDGSGDIYLMNIGGDVTIWDAGSGDLRLKNISGQIKNYDE